MANTDKDILITPNRGQTADPKIEFKGADATTGAQTISLNVYPTSNGTLSFEGSAGQLFSITNDMTGTIYSVNDISGIPSIEVDADGTIKLAEYSGNVLIGTGTDDGVNKLQVSGSMSIDSNIYISKNITHFGKPGNGSNIDGRYITIEGNTDSSGEGSSRIFFAEHNASTADMYSYGMAIGYRGGATTLPSGNTDLADVGNGEWGIWGYNGSTNGTLILAGSRAGTDFRIGTTTVTAGGNTVWHAGNDGPGSGLDADTLDGNQASAFYLASNPSGYITSGSSITGTSAGVSRTVTGTASAELVRGNMADNDQFRILVSASASNAGYAEIATADDGTEPIYVRQYTGVFSSLTRSAALLDGSGNTSFPGSITGAAFVTSNWTIDQDTNGDLTFSYA